MFHMRSLVLVVMLYPLLFPHRLELDHLAGPFGAFQTADAVAVVGVMAYIDLHGAPLVALLKEGTDVGTDLQLEKANLVEKRPDGSQGTRIPAERLVHQNGESYQSEEYEKLGVEQKPYP